MGFRKSRFSKAKARNASKRERSKSTQLSVTAINGVTPREEETPSKRYARLEPWLRLAALLHPLTHAQAPGRPGVTRTGFPPETPDEFLRRFEASGLPKALGLEPPIMVVGWRAGRAITQPMPETLEAKAERAARLQMLAMQVARTLDYFADRPAGMAVEDLGTGTVGIENFDGVFVTRVVNPLEAFCDALKGAEAVRVRRCSICGHIFYARRLTQKACSRGCNATRRVRAWRAKQRDYEYNRKLKSADVKKRGAERAARLPRGALGRGSG